MWKRISNIGKVQDYAPDIATSFYLGEQRDGVGAERQCDFANGMSVRERVIDWHEGRQFTLDAYDTEGFPVEKLHVTFALEAIDAEQTLVRETMEYRMKGGVFGRVMDVLTRGQMAKVLEDNLNGMKLHTETGITIESRDVLQRALATA